MELFSHKSYIILCILVVIAQISDEVDVNDFERILDNILIERVSGTRNNEAVKNYIANEMKSLGWNVKLDSFIDITPYGNKRFTNVIATHNPNACKRMVLACHFDSKKMKHRFLGAIDSAVPCAQMIFFAQLLNHQLNLRKNDKISLQLIFFDGEEAFVRWTSSDSLYGSRHLAAKMQSKILPRTLVNRCSKYGKLSNELSRMEVMVLLDLLGAPNPRFRNFFQSTSHLYQRLATIEQRLKERKLLTRSGRRGYFSGWSFSGGVQDDHIPFIRRGVPILHLISSPFPKQWHKPTDDRAHLDFPTIKDLNKILLLFISDYLKLHI